MVNSNHNRTFQPKLFSLFKNFSTKQFANDIIAGVIVAIIALPLSIALAIASGVEPERGLYTAIVAGFLISFFGGSKVNISGPTAAFATIVGGIVIEYKFEGLVIATIMAGIILVFMGILRLGTLIKYIPYTITTGFTSGIAVTIIIGQIKDFLGLTFPKGATPIETIEKVETIVRSINTVNPIAILVGVIGLAILIIWPKISKKIPGSLIAVLVGIVIVKFFDINVLTIGDLYEISKNSPQFNIPTIDLHTVKALIPSAFTIAILASIESLLSCVVSDGMIKDKHNSNTELIAQGIGNIFSGLFGGIPATGAIARTAANVKNGGRTPVSGIVHALVLFLMLVVLMPFAKMIPMPIIAAILFIVAYNMSEWRHFVEVLKKAPKSDILVLVTTFVLTVVFDLIIAIEVGMIIAVVLFMVKMADNVKVRLWDKNSASLRNKKIADDVEVVEISGPIFFAASEKFSSINFENDTNYIILRMQNIPALDISGIKILDSIFDRCSRIGAVLILSHVNQDPLKVLKKSGFINKIGESNIVQNIDEALGRVDEIKNEILIN